VNKKIKKTKFLVAIICEKKGEDTQFIDSQLLKE